MFKIRFRFLSSLSKPSRFLLNIQDSFKETLRQHCPSRTLKIQDSLKILKSFWGLETRTAIRTCSNLHFWLWRFSGTMRDSSGLGRAGFDSWVNCGFRVDRNGQGAIGRESLWHLIGRRAVFAFWTTRCRVYSTGLLDILAVLGRRLQSKSVVFSLRRLLMRWCCFARYSPILLPLCKWARDVFGVVPRSGPKNRRFLFYSTSR